MPSIRKRTWISPDGKHNVAWLVDYKDNEGKRRNKQFDRKKEAENWLAKAGWEIRQGIHTAASQSITIAEAAKLWLTRLALEDLEPTTVAGYEQHVRLHINPICGAHKLNELTPPKAEKIRDQFVTKLSRAMATRVLRTLRTVVAEGKRVGAVAVNVFTDVKIKRTRRGKPKVTIPLKGELRALIRVAPDMPDPMTLPLVLIAIFCGLRASELRGLPWSSVDLKQGLLTVEQRVDAKNVMGMPKSVAGYRTIPLSHRVIAALREWRLQCPKSPLNLVFPSLEKRVMSHNYMLNNILAPLQIKIGMFEDQMVRGEIVPKPRYTLHTLRHAAASLWIKRRVGPKTVQTWMGHASIQQTFDTYGHLFAKADRDGTAAGQIEDDLMGFMDAAWLQHAA